MADHAVRAPGTRGGDGFAGKVAVLIAILATLGTMFGFIGSASHNNAALYKSNAAIDKTSAANAWAHYQAKSSRQNLAELAASLPGVNQSHYREQIRRYGLEKESIREEAERLARQLDQHRGGATPPPARKAGGPPARRRPRPRSLPPSAQKDAGAG